MQTKATARVTSKPMLQTYKGPPGRSTSKAPPPKKAPGILRHRLVPHTPISATHPGGDPRTVELLTRFLASAGVPLETSEDPSFLDLVQHLNEGCVLPAVDEMSEFLEKQTSNPKPLVNYPKTVGPLSVTLDTESVRDQSFLVFSIHYFEDLYERKNVVYLRKLHLGEIHSETLLVACRRAVNNFTYQSVRFSNIVLPNEGIYEEIRHSPIVKRSFVCFYNYMTDFVREVLTIPELQNGLDELRGFVQFIRRDMDSYGKFRRMQLTKREELDVPKLDKPSSWESTVMFLTKCLVLHDTFTEYCDRFSIQMYISNTTFTHLVFFQRVLQQCIKYCRNLSQPDNSISQVIPAVNELRNHITSIDMNYRFHGGVVDSLNRCFKFVITGPSRTIYELATFLDPRYGHRDLDKSVELENRVIDDFVHAEPGLERSFFTDISLMHREERISTIKQELLAYRKVVHVQRPEEHESPFIWWGRRQTDMEFLAVISREYLATPATSISAAAYFSNSGKFHHLCETYSYTQLENYLSSAGAHQKYTGKGWVETEAITDDMKDTLTGIEKRLWKPERLRPPLYRKPPRKPVGTVRPIREQPKGDLKLRTVEAATKKIVSEEDTKCSDKLEDGETTSQIAMKSSEFSGEERPPHPRDLPVGLQPPVKPVRKGPAATPLPLNWGALADISDEPADLEQQIKLEDGEPQNPASSSKTRLMVPQKKIIRKVPFRRAPLPPPISIRAPMPAQSLKYPFQQPPQTEQLAEEVKMEEIEGDYEEFERNLEHYQRNRETRRMRAEFEEIKPEAMELAEVQGQFPMETKDPREGFRSTSFNHALCNACGFLVPRKTLKRATPGDKLLLMLACVFRGDYDIEFAQAFIKRTGNTWVCRAHFYVTLEGIFEVLNVSSSDELQECSREVLEEVMLTVNALRPTVTKEALLKMLVEFAARNRGVKEEEGSENVPKSPMESGFEFSTTGNVDSLRAAQNPEFCETRAPRQRRCQVCWLSTCRKNLKAVTIDNEKLLLMLAYVHRGDFDVETAREFMTPSSMTLVCHAHFEETLDEIYSMLHLSSPDEIQYRSDEQLHKALVIVEKLRAHVNPRQLRTLLYEFAVKNHHRIENRMRLFEVDEPPRDKVNETDDTIIVPKNQRQPRKQALETGDGGAVACSDIAQNFPMVSMGFAGFDGELEDYASHEGELEEYNDFDYVSSHNFRRGVKRHAAVEMEDSEASAMVLKAGRETKTVLEGGEEEEMKMEHLYTLASNFLEPHHDEWPTTSEQ